MAEGVGWGLNLRVHWGRVLWARTADSEATHSGFDCNFSISKLVASHNARIASTLVSSTTSFWNVTFGGRKEGRKEGSRVEGLGLRG